MTKNSSETDPLHNNDTNLDNDCEENLLETTPPVIFKQHWLAFITFIFYFLLNLMAGTSLSAFTPLESVFTKYYDLKTSDIILTSTLFLIGNAISILLVYPLNKNLGVTKTVFIGLIFNLVGVVARMGVNYHFSFVIIGQLLIGISSCCFYNNQMEFCYNWFSPKLRPVFISLLTMGVYIGGGMGNSIPLMFITPSQIDNEEDARSQVFRYTYILSIFVGILCAVNFLIFRGKPPAGYGY
jgi:fucose permease